MSTVFQFFVLLMMVLVDVPLMLYKIHIVQPLFLICNSMLVKNYNVHFRSDDVRICNFFIISLLRKLELWRQTLESKCFRLSRTKTEYMKCNFDGVVQEEGDVSLEGQVVPKKDTFRYLRLMLQRDEDIDADINLESKHGGSSGDKLLAFSMTRGTTKAKRQVL